MLELIQNCFFFQRKKKANNYADIYFSDFFGSKLLKKPFSKK